MDKKQIVSLTNRGLFKNGAARSKKQTELFVDLTLFQQDIEELMHLFQHHLQNVEIMIDDRRIIESAQLEQFEASYQAQSLLARGYWSGTTEEHASDQSEHLLIELRMSNIMAVLTSWNAVGTSEFLGRLRKVLLRRHTFVQHTLQAMTVFLFLGPPLTVVSLLEHQYIRSTLQLLIEIGAGILAVPDFVLLFTFIVTRLKLQTRIFLFPGKTTTNVSHRSGMVVRLMIALVLLMAFDGFLVLLFRLLGR
jgi:hypothetical protein